MGTWQEFIPWNAWAPVAARAKARVIIPAVWGVSHTYKALYINAVNYYYIILWNAVWWKFAMVQAVSLGAVKRHCLAKAVLKIKTPHLELMLLVSFGSKKKYLSSKININDMLSMILLKPTGHRFCFLSWPPYRPTPTKHLIKNNQIN